MTSLDNSQLQAAAAAVRILRPYIKRLSSMSTAAVATVIPPYVIRLWIVLENAWRRDDTLAMRLEALATSPSDVRTLASLQRDIEWAMRRDEHLAAAIVTIVGHAREARSTVTEAKEARAPAEDIGLATIPEPPKHHVVKIFYGTNRARSGFPEVNRFYDADRGPLECGAVDISIPFSHKSGHLERPKWYRLSFRENRRRHVTVLAIHPMLQAETLRLLQSAWRECDEPSTLTYIHGYNVTFAQGAMRTAQIAFDLLFRGVPLMYSWPSVGGMIPYMQDQESCEAAAADFQTFVEDIVLASGAERHHFIAHSMGNRTLATALRAMAAKHRRMTFNQLILSAPDIDKDVFERQIIPAISPTAKSVTMYASSKDLALRMSKLVHGYPRAGSGGSELVVLSGLDTIDASRVDTSLLGHNVIQETPLLDDLHHVVCNEMPPKQRRLIEQMKNSLPYWELPRQ